MIRQHPKADINTGKQVVSYYPVEELCQQRKENKKPSGKRWNRPSPGWTKLNVDRSYNANDDTGSIAMVPWDSNGGIICVACRSLEVCSDALEDELMACNEEANMALQWTMLPVILETNCLSITQMLLDGRMDWSSLAFVTREIKELLSERRKEDFTIQMIHRDQNRVSHQLANIARTKKKFQEDV